MNDEKDIQEEKNPMAQRKNTGSSLTFLLFQFFWHIGCLDDFKLTYMFPCHHAGGLI